MIPGARLPSERTLAAAHSVSRASVRQALQALQGQDLIETRHGGGSRCFNLLQAHLDLPSRVPTVVPCSLR
ncbi:FadR/GntR family transcriptional regulator [Nitrincola sp. A-D6]|uniref:FadR/GntR family transcriptional regulator n=1 Tax=Nitrincola sp. A-D6 TaxID=1545442 RepID=UPI00068A195E|nr:winged helix-turn-helix domain-containing protein [Nitrincola sp. A-D6]